MGKLNRRSKHKARADPVAGRPPKPVDPETEALQNSKILPALQELTSPDPSSRSTAAIAIANLIEHDACRRLLLKNQLMRVVMDQTITDSNMEVVVAGWGILRNLALEEDSGFGVHLYRQDLLTPLENVLKSIVSSLQNPHELEKVLSSSRYKIWELTQSVISLVGSLTATNQEIANSISKLSSVPVFHLCLLDESRVPVDVKEAAILCLHSISEESELLAERITNVPEWLDQLGRLIEDSNLIGVAACAILQNVSLDIEPTNESPFMNAYSDIKILSILTEFVREHAASRTCTNGTATNGKPTQSNPGAAVDLALQTIASMATSIQEMGEATSETGGAEFHEPLDEEMVNGQDTEDAIKGEEEKGQHNLTAEEEDNDMEIVTSGDFMDASDGTVIEEDAMSYIVKSTTPVLAALTIPPAETSSDDASSQETYTNALSALNNIAWTVSGFFGPVTPADSSASSPMHLTWITHANTIWSNAILPVLSSNTADLSLASLIASLAWALSLSTGKDLALNGDEHLKFMSLYQASLSLVGQGTSQTPNANTTTTSSSSSSTSSLPPAAQDLPAKCLGVLGTLALRPSSIPLNLQIGTFLLTVLQSLPNPSNTSNIPQPATPTPPAAAIEALDQLFQIYADAAYDYDAPVFQSQGFLQHLDAVQGQVKAMAKSVDGRRGREEELRKRADEAVRELGRFLKYKKAERGKV
ncbi:MAG: hypothetical protein M1837_007106 [Sclerophora amabilis]|nr:MAG: hypothetical protein M1837_007106 [Sclerophora amabilis]